MLTTQAGEHPRETAGPGLGGGALGWALLSLSFHVVVSLETVMTVGWGLFQNILRSVPTRQREVEGESCRGSQARWPSSHTLADPYALSRWESSRQRGHFAQNCRGLRRSQQLAPWPLGGLQAVATH